MVPRGEAKRPGCVGRQSRLRQQPRHKSGKNVAGPALRQVRISRGIDPYLTRAAADEGLMTFQHDPAIAEFRRKLAQGLETIRLDPRRSRFQQPRRLARVRRDHSNCILRRSLRRQPVERTGIHNDRPLKPGP